MQRRQRFRPLVERLESRDCPSLTTMYNAGTLTLSGVPTAVPGEQLLIQRVSGTNYDVRDQAPEPFTGTGGLDIGTFNITHDLHLNFTSFRADININLNGGTFPGSIFVNLGAGNKDSFLPGLVTPHPVSVYGGTGSAVNGSISFQQGSGQEIFAVGQIGFDTTSPATESVAVYGSVTATGSMASGFTGNSLFIGPASVVYGTVTGTQMNQVSVGAFLAPDGRVGGNLLINDSGSAIGADVTILGVIGGSVTVNGTNAGDTVALFDPTAPGTPGTIGGNLSALLGNGTNFVTMDTGTAVGGSVTVMGGNGANTISGNLLSGTPGFAGTVGKSMTIGFGNGNNTIALGSSNAIGGGLNVTVGGGNNAITLANQVAALASLSLGNGTNSVDVTGVMYSSFYVTAGNGTNTFTLDPGGQILGSTLSYRGGSGSNTVQILNGAANPFALNVTFVGGTRTIELGAGISLGSATLDFGTGPGTKNLLYDGGLIVTWPQIVRNFP
jgi:fibronectin-binding autotransporter adhesin